MAKKDEYSNYSLPFSTPLPMNFDMLFKHYFNFIIRDIFQVFQFEGLPDTISETFLKYCIFLNGKAVFFKTDDGELVALNGTYSDVRDIYYVPSKILVTNPTFKKTYSMTRDTECVVVYCSEIDIYNQGEFGGLYTLISRTATMLADSDLSINVAQKNKRLINILAAEDQKTKDAIDVVIRKQYDGEPYAVVMKSLIDNVQSVPIADKSNNSDIMQLIESHQYILSHFYEALGLQTHDQMKKERLITAEINDNDSLAKLNIDNILTTIQNGMNKVNEKYGTEIIVKLNPILIESKPEELESNQTTTEPEELDDNQTTTEPEEFDGNQTTTKPEEFDGNQTTTKPEEFDGNQTTTKPEEFDGNQTTTEPEELDDNQSEPEPQQENNIEIVAEDETTVEINIDNNGGVDDGSDNPVS